MEGNAPRCRGSHTKAQTTTLARALSRWTRRDKSRPSFRNWPLQKPMSPHWLIGQPNTPCCQSTLQEPTSVILVQFDRRQAECSSTSTWFFSRCFERPVFFSTALGDNTPGLRHLPARPTYSPTKMLIKRKRSDSELSFNPSFSSPSRPGTSAFDFGAMGPDNVRALSSRPSTPSHLHSRTMKRFRDNRPSEAEVHRKFPGT